MCWHPVGRCPGRRHSKKMNVDADAVAAACLPLPEVVPEFAAALVVVGQGYLLAVDEV